MINYSRLPDHIRDAARRYVEKGIPPGPFLTAVFSNDLIGAFGKADDISLRYMREIVSWLYWQCPHGARGSSKKCAQWQEHSGLEGISDAMLAEREKTMTDGTESLRDQFAMAALPVVERMIKTDDYLEPPWIWMFMAHYAYTMADAMLAEREKTND